MHVLITGGAGFIGSHTADALLAAGHKVRLLDNLSEPVHRGGKPTYIPQAAELIVGDVRRKEDWTKALQGVDAVFHFAAYQDYLPDFSTFFHVNTVGTALLYEVAVEHKLRLRKVVVASSQAAYGEGQYRNAVGDILLPDIRSRQQLEEGRWEIEHPAGPLTPLWTDETRVNPQNQYALSKYSQELVSINLGRRYQIPTVCLRYSIVQGPRQSLYNAYSGACRIFSLAYRFGRQPVIYEDGKQLRDFVNIEDVVAANLAVLEDARADYNAYNVGGGRAYTVLAFAKVVADAFGQPFAPELTGEFRFGDTRHIQSDVSRLAILGWKPRHDPAYSVAKYRDWLASQDASEEVLEYAYRRMRQAQVVGSSTPKR